MAQKQIAGSECDTQFQYMTVENIIAVKSNVLWKNNCVRVVGRVNFDEQSVNNLATLESPLESSTVKINLDVEILDHVLPQGRLLEVFGYLDVFPGQVPVLKALFYRSVSGISVTFYYKAISIRDKYTPHFNDKDDEMPRSSEDLDTSQYQE